MLGSMPKTLCNYMQVSGSFEAEEGNRATRKNFPLTVSKESLNVQVELSSVSLKQSNLTLPVSPSPSPKSKKWVPLSPSSSCSTTPSLSEVNDESMEIGQDLWESNFGINRAPWDAASEDQKDNGDNNDQFFFFVPSPVNECSSGQQHPMFHSSMFADKDDEMKEGCWIEDDEAIIPVPSKDAVAYMEQTSIIDAPELQQHQTADRNSSRQIQFALQTGLETIHEEKGYGHDDDSESSFSFSSVTDEALWDFLMPGFLIDDGGVDFLNPAPRLHDHDVLPVKSAVVDDRDPICLTPEQRAAYDCLQALAFFL